MTPRRPLLVFLLVLAMPVGACGDKASAADRAACDHAEKLASATGKAVQRERTALVAASRTASDDLRKAGRDFDAAVDEGQVVTATAALNRIEAACERLGLRRD